MAVNIRLAPQVILSSRCNSNISGNTAPRCYCFYGALRHKVQSAKKTFQRRAVERALCRECKSNLNIVRMACAGIAGKLF